MCIFINHISSQSTVSISSDSSTHNWTLFWIGCRVSKNKKECKTMRKIVSTISWKLICWKTNHIWHRVINNVSKFIKQNYNNRSLNRSTSSWVAKKKQIITFLQIHFKCARASSSVHHCLWLRKVFKAKPRVRVRKEEICCHWCRLRERDRQRKKWDRVRWIVW